MKPLANTPRGDRLACPARPGDTGPGTPGTALPTGPPADAYLDPAAAPLASLVALASLARPAGPPAPGSPPPAPGPSGPASGPARDGRLPRARWPRRTWPRRATRAGGGVDLDLAAEFIQLHRREHPAAGPVAPRLREIRREIRRTGSYRHTADELAFGARVAWRNSNRCIGRLYWQSLQVRDRRDVHTADGIAAECAEHLRAAISNGRIRPTITVFPPDTATRPGPRIWNEQLVRYAGYRQPDGTVRGEPASADLTSLAMALGWPSDGRGRFDVLPLVISAPGEPPRVFDLPADAVTEVYLVHPQFPWFGALGLRWYAVPAITDMCLEIGGICYPAAPFNGWYMGTEIGARNLADAGRYDQLPEVAARMGLDTAKDRSLWRDHALVELNRAVLHSFDTAGVTITDHHTESHRFLTHLAREERAGRVCPADWTWIVPPMSGAATGVFHRYYDDAQLRPCYARHPRDLPAAAARSAAETSS